MNVSSVALIEFCRECGALYLDACIEPWEGGYTDAALPPSARSNYALREQAKALNVPGGPTAVLTHGANPGWVSHFVKQALLDVARDCGAGCRCRATARLGAARAGTFDQGHPHRRARLADGRAAQAPGRIRQYLVG